MASSDAQGRFEQEVMPWLGAAYTLARWLLRDAHDAEDAVQEAMMRAYRHAGERRGDQPRAWLLAIVRNACYAAHRKKRSATVLPFPADGQEPPDALAPDDAPPTPESLANDATERVRLRRALDALPAEFREVVVLRELEGMSYKEIGAATGVPIGTVMSRLYRGRSQLKDLLMDTPQSELRRG